MILTKVLTWVVAIIFFLIVATILVVRSPWGQEIITRRVTSYLSEKTQTTVAIDRLFVTFRGDLYLEGFFVEDQKGDTLVYSKSLETGLKIMPLLRDGSFHISGLKWEGLVANVSRSEQGEFNFGFLLDVFSSPVDEVAGKPVQDPPKDPDNGTSSSISLGPVRFSDFLIHYDDAQIGMEVNLSLGLFEMEANSLDLNSMEFDLRKVVLSDSDISYLQRLPLPVGEESTEDPLYPALILDGLELKNIRLHYTSLPDQMTADVRIGDFLLSIPELDMRSRQLVVKELSLNRSAAHVVVSNRTLEDKKTEDGEEEAGFSWPDWDVTVGRVNLQENTLAYRTSGNSPQPGQFDPSFFTFEGFAFQAAGIALANESFSVGVEQISFSERSGFQLKQLQGKAKITNQGAMISDLRMETGHSKLRGDMELGFDGLGSFFETMVWNQAVVDVSSFQLGLRDGLYFLPALRQNPAFLQLVKKNISGVLRINGTPDKLRIADARISWGGQTRASLTGSVGNLLDLDKLRVDFPSVRFETTRSSLLEFFNEEELPVSIPEDVKLQTTFRGSLPDLFVEADLETTDGKVHAKAIYLGSDRPHYEAEIAIVDLNAGKIFRNSTLGIVSYQLHANGSGLDLDDLQLSLASNFDALEYADYDYRGLTLNGEFSNQQGNLILEFLDENLDLGVATSAQLSEEHSSLDVTLDLRGADLRALNLSEKDLRLRVNYDIHWEGNAAEFTLETQLKEGILVREGQNFPVENFDISAQISPYAVFARFESPLLQAELVSSADLAGTMNRMTSYFQGLSSEISPPVSDSLPFDFGFKFKVPRSDLLEEVLLPGLDNWKPFTGEVSFRQPAGDFLGRFVLPNFTYAGMTIDSLALAATGTAETFHVEAGLVSLRSGALEIGKTRFEGYWQSNQWALDFVAFDGDERLVHAAMDVGFDKDTLKLHLKPEELVFNKQEWTIPHSNLIRYAAGGISIRDFELSRLDQRLLLSNRLENVFEEHIGVVFKDFLLSTFTSVLNPDELIATGLVNGRFVVENPFGAAGILADLKVDELEVFSNSLGNLRVAAKSIGKRHYDFSMALKEGGITFDLFGDYQAAEAGAELNLEMDLYEFKLSVLEAFLSEQISGTTGIITGTAQVSGTMVNPIYEGKFGFVKAGLNVSALNAQYYVDDQSITLDNEGVYFDEFTIRDASQNTFVFGGLIATQDLTNPEFNLQLTAENFIVLNSSREDNDLFFGKAIIDASAAIKGDLTLPQVNAKLNVRSGTDVTFIIPESQLDIIERDGVVLFINRQDPEDILTRRKTEEVTSGITGFQISARLEADPDAAFRIIVDERFGDNLLIAGKANLNLDVDPNGRIDLSGIYEMSTGHYEMSLYNLVSRRFEIEEGSTISWAGDPLDASLNIVAIYRVRTSAAELMAAQTAGLGAEARAQYKQELPFLVYLNIDGDLTRLEPSFRLDMPEDQRGASGGNVYGQLQLLNTQEDELNRQVFSLLVLNRFFPDRGGSGAGGGASALARSSVSQLLSGQLNTLSENVLGDSGLELDFDLDSFTDYQSGGPRDRTQLNVSARSRFMDDRLIVQVGSQIDIEGSSQVMDRGNALLGNVSVEYLLTESGRYRLRGFRRNQFESFIDGQLIVTGISLIFNREFNHFDELWRGIESRRNASPANRREEDKEDSGAKEQKP